MAHFRATIKGARGESSRCGTKNSGIHASVNGWHIGCDVDITHEKRRDVVEVRLTNGSSGGMRVPIGTFRIPPDERRRLREIRERREADNGH